VQILHRKMAEENNQGAPYFVFLSMNAIVSWLIKLAPYFCQSLLITGQVYCQMIKVDWLPAGVLLRELAHRLQILPANEKLGLEADKILIPC
jgi:hypothetical protein